MPGFIAAVTCIDGRFHAPLVAWARREFAVDHVDLVTSPGVSAALARSVTAVTDHVFDDLAPSLEAHHATVIVLAAHEGCAADPSPPDQQREDLILAAEVLRDRLGHRAAVLPVHLAADGTLDRVASRTPAPTARGRGDGR